MDRFAPQQRTNYVSLLNEWAIGFYTELDFLNEAANQQTLKVSYLSILFYVYLREVKIQLLSSSL